MKKYLLFAGYDLTDTGGWDNFICDGETVKSLMDSILEQNKTRLYDWWHIIDKESGEEMMDSLSYKIALEQHP